MKARIEYGLGRTLNMGDFESTRVHVSVAIEVEDKISRDELEKTFGRIKKFVDEKVAEEEAHWKL